MTEKPARPSAKGKVDVDLLAIVRAVRGARDDEEAARRIKKHVDNAVAFASLGATAAAQKRLEREQIMATIRHRIESMAVSMANARNDGNWQRYLPIAEVLDAAIRAHKRHDQ